MFAGNDREIIMLRVINTTPVETTTGIVSSRDSLAARLRDARLGKGWSQEYLASRAETSQAVIQKIENGKSLRPRNIERIADALGMAPAWLMFGVRETNQLDEDAIQVARAWSQLKEPERSAMRETIHRLSRKAVIGL